MCDEQNIHTKAVSTFSKHELDDIYIKKKKKNRVNYLLIHL